MWQLGDTSGKYDSGAYTSETLDIGFPKTGMAIEKLSKFHWTDSNGQWQELTISEEQNTLFVAAVKAPIEGDQNGQPDKLWTLFPIVSESTSRKWELPAVFNPVPAQGTQISEVTTKTYFDEQPAPTADLVTKLTWGNITKVEVEYASGVSTVTSNVYGPDPEDKRFGRLSNATVTHEDDGSAIPEEIRSSAFTYYENGLLWTETVQPGNALALTTTYERDDYGNVIEKKVEGAFGAPSSGGAFALDSVIVEKIPDDGWDTHHRWATKKENGVGDQESFEYRSPYGEMRSQEGPNGATTHWQYDAFGRATKETRPDSTWTSTTLKPVPAGTPVTVTGPSGTWQYPLVSHAVYMVEVTGLETPKSITYYDRLGREIRASAQSLNSVPANQWVSKDTVYGQHGEVLAVSGNYFDGEEAGNILWTTTIYDKLLRPWIVSAPNQTEVVYDYQGLTTWVSKNVKDGSGNIISTRKSGTVKDVKGQVVETHNADPLTDGATVIGVVHEYSASGNLLATLPNNLASQKITFSYNVLGNKTGMIDPDMGSWTYKYDALGRLRWAAGC